MKRFIQTAAIASILALTACGQNTDSQVVEPMSVAKAPQVTTVSMERNGNWLLSTRQSHLRFSAEQEGKTFEGEFKRFSAEINFYPERLDNSSVRVTVPLGSVDAGSNDRNSALPDKVWFSVKAFPQAVFESTNFSKTGEDSYLAKGTLSMKGISQDFDLPFTLTYNDRGQAVMRANPSLNRKDWKVGEAPYDNGDTISTAVKLDILVVASNPG